MRIIGRQWLTAAAAIACAFGTASVSADVQAGIEMWRAGDYEAAIREWRPLAERGDADAQFNLGQAYKLGRGVPVDLRQAQTWYERAARQGHGQAEANLGLTLFQTGQQQQALPWLQRAAGRGDPRAQYVLATAHFNGDIVERDWPRAYALMRRAADQGLPQAASSIAEMERHLSEQDRERGLVLARQMAAGTPAVAQAEIPAGRAPATSPARAPRVAQAQPPVVRTPVPPSTPVRRPVQPAPPVQAPRAQTPAPAQAAAGGRWRVQLGAFSQAGNAERQWQAVRSVAGISGLQRHLVRAGAVTRLQAGPLASRAAADRVCAAARAAGHACIVVAP